MNRFFLVIVSIVITLTSCEKINSITNFNLQYNTDVTIPSSIGIDLPLDLLTPPVNTNSETEFESHKTTKDLVKEIYLEKVAIKVTSPPNRDLSFLKSIHIYIRAEGLSELLLASAENIPDEVGTSLNLEISGDDFKAYIKKDSYTLRVNAVTDKLISQDVELDVASEFKVVARLIN